MKEAEALLMSFVRANTEGLVSLAKLLLFVAKEEHKEGYHVHLDAIVVGAVE
jgi:hypothetical protein